MVMVQLPTLPIILLISLVMSFRNTFNTGAAALSTASKLDKQAGALVFLHGLGDTPAGWSSIRTILPQIRPRLSSIKYIFPPAPTIGITINGGAEMPGWFDLYDWPIGLSARDDREGVGRGVSTILKIVRNLNDEGIPTDKIVVGGFSQGGAVALAAAYGGSDVPRYAGCASLSGWITPKDVVGRVGATPLFWAHGRYDDKVLFEQQAHGIEALREGGVEKITSKVYDMGHESDPDELEALAEFVERAIFGAETDGGEL